MGSSARNALVAELAGVPTTPAMLYPVDEVQARLLGFQTVIFEVQCRLIAELGDHLLSRTLPPNIRAEIDNFPRSQTHDRSLSCQTEKRQREVDARAIADCSSPIVMPKLTLKTASHPAPSPSDSGRRVVQIQCLCRRRRAGDRHRGPFRRCYCKKKYRSTSLTMLASLSRSCCRHFVPCATCFAGFSSPPSNGTSLVLAIM